MQNKTDTDTRKHEHKQAVLNALSAGRPMRYSELRKIARSNLPIRELVEDGEIQKGALGLYTLPERNSTWDMLSSLSARYPNAVICFASAAAYHGLTTQNPHEVWAAFPYLTSIPKPADLAIRGFRWKETSMVTGVETVEIGNTSVKMTSPARTVVDLLRTMNKTGETETAMEALGNYTGRPGDILKIARELGADNSVRPYIQAIQGLGRSR